MLSVPSDEFIETSSVYGKEEGLMKKAPITLETKEGISASPSWQTSQEVTIAQDRGAPGLASWKSWTWCWGSGKKVGELDGERAMGARSCREVNSVLGRQSAD